MYRQQRVFAAEHRKRFVNARHRTQEMVHVGIARLHPDDVLVAGQFVQHFRGDRDARAVRDLVDHHGQRRGVCVAQEVVADAGLRRGRVVGGQHHQRVGAGVGEFLAGLQGVVKAGVQYAGDHRHAAFDGFYRQLAHADAFGAGQCAVFARAAQRHDAVDALLEQVGDQRAGRRDVDGVVRVDRGRDGGEDTAKMGCVQHVANPKR
ncbi:hypothetical protein G6F22_013189 [Rhizopus arrhizus]|nr:hypothetical protein G6F22_013189 [Rhizopus arrhizus]